MLIVFITAIDFLDFRWRILIRFLYSLPRRAFRHGAGFKQKVNTRRHVGDYDNICRRNFKTPASIVWCQVWGSCPWLSTSCVKKFPINCAGLPKTPNVQMPVCSLKHTTSRLTSCRVRVGFLRTRIWVDYSYYVGQTAGLSHSTTRTAPD